MRRVCESSQDQSANFFDPNNQDMKRIRDEIALSVLEQLIGWLKEGGRVAIHDATNSTLARRYVLLLVSCWIQGKINRFFSSCVENC
jgi:6-phosphofructo-2-kinase